MFKVLFALCRIVHGTILRVVAFFFSFFRKSFFCVEEVAQVAHAFAAEYAEDISLLWGEFLRSVAAEDGQLFTKEGLDACKREMRQSRTAVEQSVNSLANVRNSSSIRVNLAYLQRQIDAIAEMDSLQTALMCSARVIWMQGFPHKDLWMCKRLYASVRYRLALHKANAPQLWQTRQMRDRCICQVITACQINVSNSIASLDQCHDSVVRQIAAMPEMDVMQILSQPTNCLHCCICDVPAFGQDQVP